MNYTAYEKLLYYKLFFKGIKRKDKSHLVLSARSWLVAVDALVLLHPTPPQRLDVFGSQPAVSGQGGLSQAQRQQPADERNSQITSHSHISQLP